MATVVAAWPMMALGEVAQPVERAEVPVAGKEYRQVGVRLWGEGAYEREPIDGGATQYKTLSRVEANDIIVNKIWARNGSVSVVPEHLAGAYVSGEFPTFTPIRERLNPRWFFWLTKTRPFWEQCDEKSRGTSGKNRIRPEKFLQIEIPLPPLDEQRRIVARIEELAARIEQARGLRREAMAEAEKLRTGILSQLFDFDTDQQLPEGWTWQLLPSLLTDSRQGMTTGPFGTLLQKSDILTDGVPVLGIANIQTNRFVPGFDDYVSLSKAEELSSYQLRDGDIVVARSGTVGRSCVIPRIIGPSPIMSTNLMRLRIKQDFFLPELLCRLLNDSHLVERHKDTECRGSTREFFTQKILSRLAIPVPPFREQQSILHFIHQIDARVDLVKELQSSISAELDALLPSVLDKAFRGEL